jgi:hypothetical protein
VSTLCDDELLFGIDDRIQYGKYFVPLANDIAAYSAFHDHIPQMYKGFVWCM